MNLTKFLEQGNIKITFKGLLFLVAVLYTGVYFLSGDLLTQLPSNWFTNWLGEVFSLMDEHGFLNVWSGQNPGTHYLYYLLWKPSQALVGDAWYLGGLFSLLWYFVSISALFLSVYFFYKIVEHISGEQKAVILGLIYIIIFMTFEWFKVIDSLPIAVLLGAIYYGLKGSVRRGGFLLGLGASLKPIGLFILPVILKSDTYTKNQKILFTAVSVSTFSILMLPFIIGNFDIFISAFNWQSGRPPWETIYALAMTFSGNPVPMDPFFQDFSGIVQRNWGWTGITPVHSMMTTPVPDYNHWYSMVFMLFLSTAIGAFMLFKKIQTEKEFIWGCLFCLSIYFAVFYGWSPNFFFWIAPFLLILFPIVIPVAFRLVILLEYPLFYGLHLAYTSPDLVSSVSGLPASVTSTLSPLGMGFWFIIIIKTAILLFFSVRSWRELPSENLVVYWRQRYILWSKGNKSETAATGIK
ncbi:hypothetical protein ABFB09_03950 [Dehalogenimonas sp. THU2]|uniref:hypothetical protein n=1 Tax=Dehalogenimonas sp. THU2 TaxID=3151121 RepID=UPI00321899AE